MSTEQTEFFSGFFLSLKNCAILHAFMSILYVGKDNLMMTASYYQVKRMEMDRAGFSIHWVNATKPQGLLTYFCGEKLKNSCDMVFYPKFCKSSFVLTEYFGAYLYSVKVTSLKTNVS